MRSIWKGRERGSEGKGSSRLKSLNLREKCWRREIRPAKHKTRQRERAWHSKTPQNLVLRPNSSGAIRIGIMRPTRNSTPRNRTSWRQRSQRKTGSPHRETGTTSYDRPRHLSPSSIAFSREDSLVGKEVV